MRYLRNNPAFLLMVATEKLGLRRDARNQASSLQRGVTTLSRDTLSAVEPGSLRARSRGTMPRQMPEQVTGQSSNKNGGRAGS